MADATNTARFVLAVSGGVDSMVLLHRFACQFQANELVVAHVDHGIRAEGADDAAFVRQAAHQLGLRYEETKLFLGESAGEAKARRERYAFLRKVANKYDAQLVTAHHADDVVETVAINLVRGTGWRGVAVMGSPDIERPQTTMFKHEIIAYAKQHDIAWREDATNASDVYLRNRLRQRLTSLTQDEKLQLLGLWRTQLDITTNVRAANMALETNQREWYRETTDDDVATEALRHWLIVRNVRLTRPQLRRCLEAIRTLRPGAMVMLTGGSYLKMSKASFTLHP